MKTEIIVKKFMELLLQNKEIPDKEDLTSLKDYEQFFNSPETLENINYIFEYFEKERIIKWIIDGIRDSLDLNKILQTTVEEVGKLLKVDRCIVALINKTTENFELKSEYRINEDISVILGSELLINCSSDFCNKIIKDQMPIILNNTSFPDLVNEETKGFYKQNKSKSVIIIPIIHKNEVLGALSVHQVHYQREWNQKDIELLADIADQIAIAIKQAELYITSNKQVEREALLRKITNTIRSSLDIDEVLNTICSELFNLFKVDKVALSRYSEPNNIPFWSFLVEHQTKTIPLLQHINSSPETSTYFAKRIYDADKNIIIENMNESDYPEFFRNIYLNLQIKSLLAVPIRKDNEKWGAIGLLQSDYYREWSQDEINLLTTIADNISIAIKQAELYSITKKQAEIEKQNAERERTLRTIISKIRKSLDIDETLDITTREIAELFNIGRVSIFQYPNKNNYQEFLLMREYKVKEDIKGFQYFEDDNKPGEYLAKVLFNNDESSLAVDNVSEFNFPEYFKDFYEAIEAKSVLITSIRQNEDLWGVICLTEYDSYRHWSLEEIRLLETIAHQIYISIDQARLFSQIQQATRLKSEFLANMSHEVRTPLNAIIGFSEMLEKGYYGQLNDKGLEYLKNISISGKHLLKLVNNILDLSKIESGNANMTYEKFNSDYVIKEVIFTLESLARKKNISIELDLKNATIIGDTGKFRQIIYNLVSNSIKFTPENGNINVSTKFENNKLKVSIEDNGIGIAKKDHDKIFKEFVQLDSSYTRKQEGTGLGLTLTKKLVELHKGEIYFESEEGKKTKFWFILPNASLSD